MPGGIDKEFQAVAFRIAEIEGPGGAMGNRLIVKAAVGRDGVMKASKGFQVIDAEG